MRWVKLLIIPVIFITACNFEFVDDIDKIGSSYWSPTIGLPVIGGTFTIGDYVDAISDEITVSQTPEGLVVFEYKGEDIKSDMAEALMAIPDQSFNSSTGFTVAEIAALPVDLSLTKTATFGFTINTESSDVLDSVLLKSGILNLDVTGNLPVSGQVEIVMTPIKLNQQVLKRTFTWTYNPGNPGQSFQETIDLTNAYIDFTNNGAATNNFNFDVVLTIQYEGQPLTTANTLDVNIGMTNLGFRVLFGKFSQRNFVTDKASVILGILDSVDATGFYLDDPQIDFHFQNSFGLPVTAQLTSLIATNTSGQTMPFTGTIIASPTAVNSPSVAELGTYSETSISITKDNSNINDIIAFLPNELSYQFEGSVDPQDPLIEQFVLDTSQVIGSYTVKLPLSGSVAEFSSTKDFDFDGTDLDVLKETKVILHTTNGLPLTVAVALVFLDAADNPIDTLFAGTNLLSPGTLDSNGFVTTANETSVEELLTQEEIEVLQDSKKIRLISTMHTGLNGTENVKIRMQDEVKASVYIQTTLGF